MRIELRDEKRHVDTYEIDDELGAALIFDGGIRGVWTSNAVVEFARAYGWDGTDSEEDLDADSEEPCLINTAMEATEWLNGLTPEGWSFDFLDGDFILANEEWWSDVSD